jgi:hypothetical protein
VGPKAVGPSNSICDERRWSPDLKEGRLTTPGLLPARVRFLNLLKLSADCLTPELASDEGNRAADFDLSDLSADDIVGELRRLVDCG